jgi:hypothetical protein
MRTFTPPRMHVVRKEEKETRLTTFVAELLANASASDVSGSGLTVLARSPESPVLKALAAHADAIRAAGLRMRAIIVLDEAASPQVNALLAGAAARCACDARLLDAHEQMAVGDRVAWIGDCMRREPAKRDAYEIYSADCAETAAVAHRSFDRVWSFTGSGKSESVAAAPARVAVPAPVEVPIAAIAEGETAPVVSTRH